jgi:putative phage-type endonuclease
MLWEEKTNLTTCAPTKAMQHGLKYEEPAMLWLENKVGMKFDRQNQLEHTKHNWMRATLDGLNRESKLVAEIKCPYNLSRHEATKSSGRIPDIYWPQVQHQIEVAGASGALFLSYNYKCPDDSFLLEVERDDSYIKKMLEEEATFWNHVVNLTQPPLTELDYQERDSMWASLAREKFNVSKKIKELKAQDEALRDKLIEMSEEESSRGEGFYYTKYQERGRIDYDGLLEKFGISQEEADLHRKSPTTSWRLSLKQ